MILLFDEQQPIQPRGESERILADHLALMIHLRPDLQVGIAVPGRFCGLGKLLEFFIKRRSLKDCEVGTI